MHVSLKLYRGVILTILLALFLLCGFFAWLLFGTENVTEISVTPSENFISTTTPFLSEEEVVIIAQNSETGEEQILPIEKVLFTYVEVIDGCGIHYEGECLLVHSGPGLDFPVVAHLRNDMVLKVDGKVEHDGYVWYKIVFDEWLRYPERVEGDWYVAADFVEVLFDEGLRTLDDHEKSTTTKKIIVDRSAQTLTALDGDTVFMTTKISTGLELTPTPTGTFSIFRKTPSRYMQGPMPNVSDQYYDLPGVPWNLYFTHGGAVIHGAYWHDSFGSAYSHGCVNLPPDEAKKLYIWADLGTKVVVKE